MNHGDMNRSPLLAVRPRRAALLVVAALGLLSACSGTGGSDNAADTTAAIGGESTTVVSDAEGAPAGGQVVDCMDVDPTTWRAAPTDIDLPTKVGNGEAAGLGGEVSGAPDDFVLYPTPDTFLAQSNVSDPAARKAAMEEAGYRGGIEANWVSAGYTVQVLNFADAASVASYVVVRLPNLCGNGGTQSGVTVLNDGDGIMWADPLGASHAEFILGGSQVSFTTCGCADPVSLADMQAWHDAFVEDYAAGAPVPVV